MKANTSRVTGEALKKLREDAGLKQTELAARLGVYQSRISNYESGERTLHAHEIFDYAKALGVTPHNLLDAIQKALEE